LILQAFESAHVLNDAINLVKRTILLFNYFVQNMIKISEPVELEGKEGSLLEVLLSDEMTQFLLLLYSLELLCFVFLFLFGGMISPNLDDRVTATSHHVYRAHESIGLSIAFLVTSICSLFQFLYFLMQLHRPNLIRMHLEGVHALLLLHVPDFDDAVD